MSKDWKEYFDEKAKTHGESVKSSDYFDEESFFAQRDNILKWLGQTENLEILDAGCGVGGFSEPLVKNNKVYGVDFSANSLEFAAKRGLITSVGDLGNLSFPDGKFDIVVCIGVIQLIENYKPILRELARVVKPGGIMLIQTLHKASVQRKVVLMFEQNKKFDKMYTMPELKAMYDELGFENIEFLKQYHPFKTVCTGKHSSMGDAFCTSFSIKGYKK